MNTHNNLSEIRFRLNMGRIRGLLALSFSDIAALSETEPFQTDGFRADILRAIQTDGVRADILRTAVVFLHATFEDVLRTSARERIATTELEDVLNEIPLVGTGRPKKFFLGALNAHRRKTVDQLIQESVEDYLDEKSFSSTDDIDWVLMRMGLDTGPFKSLYADLEQMMRRRHRIVHDADLPSPKDTVSGPWTIEDYLNLCVWLITVPIFCGQLRLEVDPADEVQRWFVASRTKAIEFAREVRAEFIALLKQPQPEKEEFCAGLLKASKRLSEVVAHLAGPSAEEVFQIWKTMHSPDDDTNDEQARAKIIAWRDHGK